MDDQSQQDSVQSRGKTRYSGILPGTKALVEGLRYQPQTQATQATFDSILTIVAKNLGDVPQTVLRIAADVVLEYLKDEDLKDLDKKKEIDDLLGASLNLKEFNKLVNLGKKITDYDAEDDCNGEDDYDAEDDYHAENDYDAEDEATISR